MLSTFAEKELAGGPDVGGRIDRRTWRACADIGLQGLIVPEIYGGSGGTVVDVVGALEALGYGGADSGLLFALNAHLWACEYPLVRFGSEDQKRRYLPGLTDGTLIGAHAMSEPESGSDAFSLGTSAVKSSNGYTLTGSKTFVTNAPDADLLVVFATTNASLRFAGLCAFLVERETLGLTIGPPLHKMGLLGAPMSELFLDNCEVSGQNLLGRAGAGMVIFNATMGRERGLILSSALGTMRRRLEKSLDYARQRVQFGQPIGKYQAVSHRLVDMKVRLESAQLLLYRLGWLMDQGRATELESALVKLYLSEAFVQSSLDAQQVYGGYGYMAEYEVEGEVRDALGSRLYSGTSDIQRNVIASQLGL